MTHQITGVGLAAAGCAAAGVSGTTVAAVIGAAWLGSLLPDADKRGSRVYHRTRLERRHLLARGAGALARLPLRTLGLFGHRGITHSLLAVALAAAALGALASLVAPSVAGAVAVGCAVGYGAHVLADACTPGGVPLFAPLSGRRRWLLPRWARIPTGSLRELALAAVLAALSVGLTVVLAT